MSTSAKIRETAAAFPELKPKAIAEMLGVKPAYVSSVLWAQKNKPVPAKLHKQHGAERAEELEARNKRALDVQVGGDHYKKLKIQPVEYIHANNLGYFEGNVVKYVTRWRDKNGIADLEKAKHYIDLLIEQETGK